MTKNKSPGDGQAVEDWYDAVNGEWYPLPDGWKDPEHRSGDIYHDGGTLRIGITGPSGRWVVQKKNDRGGWSTMRGIRGRRPLYYKSGLAAITAGEVRYLTPRKP